MSRNYAKGQPVGDNLVPLYECPPAIKALEQYVYENGTTSSVITVTQNTTAIEIAAGATAAAMAWIPVSDTTASVIAIAGATANYDHIIPANMVRRFVIPIEVQNNSQGYSSMVGDNVANGLYRRVAIKSQGIGSVLLSEYGRSNTY